MAEFLWALSIPVSVVALLYGVIIVRAIQDRRQ